MKSNYEQEVVISEEKMWGGGWGGWKGEGCIWEGWGSGNSLSHSGDELQGWGSSRPKMFTNIN